MTIKIGMRRELAIGVPRMLRSAPRLRRGALLIRGRNEAQRLSRDA
jgi:hypothetical protein